MLELPPPPQRDISWSRCKLSVYIKCLYTNGSGSTRPRNVALRGWGLEFAASLSMRQDDTYIGLIIDSKGKLGELSILLDFSSTMLEYSSVAACKFKHYA